jgi:2-phosphoglycerate kinase
LAREVVALRLAIKDVATKDFIRSELRALLEELDNAAPNDKP